MSDKERYYETNIINPTIKVVALSDIHGDIQSFIISLRDCAKVIRKKTPTVDTDAPDLMKYEEYSFEKYDENMEQILLLDLNTDEDKYIEDLNYEWCGGTTHVVICGDIIDPYRAAAHTHCLKTSTQPCSYYPQIELKILMFINALNVQAALTCGKIIKLLGNHELGNIISDPDPGYKDDYTYPQDQTSGYYQGVNRIDIFRVGKFGFKLLMEGGCGILVKINNTIFVHGDLLDSYHTYDTLNQYINDPTKHDGVHQDNWNSTFRNANMIGQYVVPKSSLLSRARGDPGTASNRIIAGHSGNTGPSETFCDNLVKSFELFKGNGTVIKEDVNSLKLVIGHCVQSDLSNSHLNPRPLAGTTYHKIIQSDHVRDVFGEDIYSGPPVFDKTQPRTKIFGITMECLIPDTTVNRVYRVDIGSSRGFDYYNKLIQFPFPINYPITVEDENQFLYSKTPQILEINTDGRINIIKSKMRNTRIHLPRPDYEQSIKTIPELDIDTDHEYYKYKYFKYKNKYLQLKYVI